MMDRWTVCVYCCETLRRIQQCPCRALAEDTKPQSNHKDIPDIHKMRNIHIYIYVKSVGGAKYGKRCYLKKNRLDCKCNAKFKLFFCCFLVCFFFFLKFSFSLILLYCYRPSKPSCKCNCKSGGYRLALSPRVALW